MGVSQFCPYPHCCGYAFQSRSSYLRHLPNYYKGVDPVIDHDKGNRDGVLGHSTKLPQLPPVAFNFSLDWS